MIDGPHEDWGSALQGEAVRFLADAIPGPVSYLDRDLRYRFVNAAYAEVLARAESDLTPETILGNTPIEAFGPERAATLIDNLKRALAGELVTVEVGLSNVMRTLNSYIPHVVQGEVLGVLLVAQDITDLHASRNALIQAERMATLGRLMGGLLHEINTPVGVLRSSLQTLTRGLDRLHGRGEMGAQAALSQLHGLAQTALEATERVIAMTERLRNFAKVDEAQLQRIDLHDGLESTLFLLRSQLRPEIDVIKRFGHLPAVVCEPASINQVYMALLSNAIRAIEGAGTLTIRTWADDTHAHVEVSDTGVGIDRDRLPTLFSPSFAAGGERVKAGLGLYVARSIVEQHRGRIEVNSEVGAGSTFTLTLPR